MPGNHARRYWLALHRWLGLGLGILVAFLGLTGSLLVFWYETERVLRPGMFSGAVASDATPDDLVAAAKRAYPDLGAPMRIDYIQGPEDIPPIVTIGGPDGPVEVTVDPETRDVLGRRQQSHGVMWWIFDLHASLAFSRAGMPATGHVATGVVGIGMLLSLISGIVIWWPRHKRFRIVMTVKWRASGHRFAVDLHRVISIYSFIVLLALSVTGVYLAKPEWIMPLMRLFGPVARTAPIPTPLDPPCPGTVSATEALAAARTLRPVEKLAAINFAQPPLRPYAVQFFKADSPRRIQGGSDVVWVDPSCGIILGIRTPSSAADMVIDWMLPLHSGEAFGVIGRLLVCITGVIPAVLLGTGVLIWLRRHAAHRYRKAHELG